MPAGERSGSTVGAGDGGVGGAHGFERAAGTLRRLTAIVADAAELGVVESTDNGKLLREMHGGRVGCGLAGLLRQHRGLKPLVGDIPSDQQL